MSSQMTRCACHLRDRETVLSGEVIFRMFFIKRIATSPYEQSQYHGVYPTTSQELGEMDEIHLLEQCAK